MPSRMRIETEMRHTRIRVIISENENRLFIYENIPSGGGQKKDRLALNQTAIEPKPHQITLYSLSIFSISVPWIFSMTFLRANFSMILNCISVIFLPSLSFTVASRRFLTS